MPLFSMEKKVVVAYKFPQGDKVKEPQMLLETAVAHI